jgi:hypothetical protein
MELLIPFGSEYSNVCSHLLISKSMNSILPVVCIGVKIWSLALRQKHMLVVVGE